LHVLAAICFHNQSQAEMHKVDDVGADGLLAAELLTIHTVGAQVLPEQLFGVGHVLAQGFGELALVHGRGPSPPAPLPQGARGARCKADIVRER
jgi:hypothetical protein